MWSTQLSLGINVVHVQPAGHSDPEPESVTQGKDGMVGRAPTGGPGIVGKGSGRLEQLAGLGWIE
jgi:hypothetical protein